MGGPRLWDGEPGPEFVRTPVSSFQPGPTDRLSRDAPAAGRPTVPDAKETGQG